MVATTKLIHTTSKIVGDTQNGTDALASGELIPQDQLQQQIRK